MMRKSLMMICLAVICLSGCRGNVPKQQTETSSETEKPTETETEKPTETETEKPTETETEKPVETPVKSQPGASQPQTPAQPQTEAYVLPQTEAYVSPQTSAPAENGEGGFVDLEPVTSPYEEEYMQCPYCAHWFSTIPDGGLWNPYDRHVLEERDRSGGETESSMAQCPDCGGWFETGNIFRNHLCPAREQ